MARRSRDWNEGLAEDLRDPAFAREFIVAALEEGISLQEALGKVVRAYGIKEYAAEANIAAPNLMRAINPKSNPTQQTLERLLAPLELQLTVGPRQNRKRHVA
jgi:DNA-binding phage protein